MPGKRALHYKWVRVRVRVRVNALYPNPNQVEYATRHPHVRPQLAQAQARGG